MSVFHTNSEAVSQLCPWCCLVVHFTALHTCRIVLTTPSSLLHHFWAIRSHFFSNGLCWRFGCFAQVIVCVARAGSSVTTTRSRRVWGWRRWTLRHDVYCSFLKRWHSLNHSDEQGAWFTLSKNFDLIISSQYKRRFFLGSPTNVVHIKHFQCMVLKPPLLSRILNSTCFHNHLL